MNSWPRRCRLLDCKPRQLGRMTQPVRASDLQLRVGEGVHRPRARYALEDVFPAVFDGYRIACGGVRGARQNDVAAAGVVQEARGDDDVHARDVVAASIDVTDVHSDADVETLVA